MIRLASILVLLATASSLSPASAQDLRCGAVSVASQAVPCPPPAIATRAGDLDGLRAVLRVRFDPARRDTNRPHDPTRMALITGPNGALFAF